jgi:hypothetical protein
LTKTTTKENTKQVDCDCAIGDLIMKIKAGALKMEHPRERPFIVICVHANGNETMQKGPVKTRSNMRQTIPFVKQIRKLIQTTFHHHTVVCLCDLLGRRVECALAAFVCHLMQTNVLEQRA